MKQCSKCKEMKAFSEFYKAEKRRDGLQAYCKTCSRVKTSEYSKSEKGTLARKKYRQTHKFMEYNRTNMAKYRKTEKGKQILSQINRSEKGKQRYARQRQSDRYKSRHGIDSKKYRQNHPEIIKAHNAISVAIRQGKLPKPDTLICKCNSPAKHYHHYLGYNPENRLDVIPLCVQCHTNEHNTHKHTE